MKSLSKKSIKNLKNVKKHILTKVQKSKVKGGVGSEDVIII